MGEPGRLVHDVAIFGGRALVDFILWDTPTSMIPTIERVCRMMAGLMARDDTGHPVVIAAVAEVWRFFDPDQATRH